MKCAHCAVSFSWDPRISTIGWSFKPPDALTRLPDKAVVQWNALAQSCPECGEMLLMLERIPVDGTERTFELVWPRASAAPPRPAEVPQEIYAAYADAVVVLPFSPNASAALSRRCLQAVLRNAAKVEPGDLYDEIEEALPKVPGYLADELHQVRVVGAFAAHPNKSKATGEILDVEPGEAEWNIGVLDDAFDFFYIRPARSDERRANVNSKLEAAGKPPLPPKTP